MQTGGDMERDTSPFVLAVGYWSGLGAPDTAIAAALRSTVEAVAAARAEGVEVPAGLAGYPSGVAWAARTANALILAGLARPPGEPLVCIGGEGVLTVGEVRAAVARVAAGLAAAGVGRGTAVAVDATQRLESWLVATATLLLGGVVVRLSLAAGVEGVRAMLGAAPAGLTFSVHAAELAGLVAAGVCIDLDGDGFADWLDAAPEAADLPVVAVAPGDPALAGSTSGSTGAPKAVVTSHGAVFRSTEAMQALFGFDAGDIFATSTDFSALSGFRSMLTLPLLCGGRLLLPSAPARESPLALAAECADHGVTRLTAVPNVLRGLARAGAAGRLPPLPALRGVFSGSGVLDQTSRDACQAALGVPVIDYYGGREFATAVYSQPQGDRTVSSGGGIICNALVRIVDDAGEELPMGEVGGIMIHSDCLTLSELAGDHAAWAGWHESGDLGRITIEGGLQVVGRRRDIIKAGDGSLVFPVEIETLLGRLAEVKESCVFGVAGNSGGERIIAVVSLARPPIGGAAAFADDVRQQMLAAAGHFRVPARVIVVDEFPRVGAGKIDKPELRRRLAAELVFEGGSPA